MIIRVIAAIFLLWLFGRLVKGIAKKFTSVAGGVSGAKPQGQVAEMKQDPQCGSYVSVNHAVRADINGQERYFCSEECAQKFRRKG